MTTLSIKGKLYLALATLIVFMFSATLLFAFFGYEHYYMWQKKRTMAKLGEQIEGMYKAKGADSFDSIDSISSHMGVIITVIDTDKKIAYTSRPKRMPITQGSGRDIAPTTFSEDTFWQKYLISDTPTEAFDAKTRFLTLSSGEKISELILIRQLERNDALFMRQPLAPIQEGVSIALTFITASGFVCLILGSILIWQYTERLTTPLTNLIHIASNMSNLDFSKKWTDSRSDELGILGNTLNHLSQELDSTIQKLNNSNERLELELNRARSLDEMRKDFISSVSHELKTPLALIQGYAEGLTMENMAQNEAMRNHYASIIINETGKMDKLVRDLLNLSQLEAGAFTLEKIRFDLDALLHEIITNFSSPIQNKNLVLNLNISPMPFAYGDGMRLNQVFTNLISNAIDYTDKGKKITISSEEFADHYKITIENEGEQIPIEEMERLWTAFYKRDKARTRTFGGYGLGLSIVRTLQELHGQKYGLYNTPSGVAFWVTVAKA